MVLTHESEHVYDYDFSTATLAYFNRYPNPYAGHVVSCDTVAHRLSGSGSELLIERLIHKQGSLPRFLRPLLGKITDAWILETTLVDRGRRTLRSWARNLDHRNILRVDDTSVYEDAGPVTRVINRVRFSSGLNFGFRNRVEKWSQRSFAERIQDSRRGMAHVMALVRNAMFQKQLS